MRPKESHPVKGIRSFTVCAIALMVQSGFAAAKDNPYATHHDLGLMQGFPPPDDKRVDRSPGLLGVPYNRWYCQTIRTLFPTAGIPGPWDARLVLLQGCLPSNVEALAKGVAKQRRM
mgnify:FL=1